MEKINIDGTIKAISNPFSGHPIESKIVTIETKKGMVSIPVKDAHKYAMNQKVNILVEIKEID